MLTTREVAALFDVAVPTVTSWVQKQWLVPADRSSTGGYLFTEAEVQRWLKVHMARPSTAFRLARKGLRRV